MTLPARQNLLGGLLLVLIGAGVVLQARTLSVGVLTQMGAGYFPIVLGCILAGLGAIMAAGALIAPANVAASTVFVPTDWRGCGAIVAGLLAFLLVGWRFGLAPATFCCVLIAACGDRTTSPKRALVLAIAMTIFTIALFSYLLKLQFPIFRW